MVLDFKTYRDKVLGCWMGKNIGGVLGAPFEGIRQFNDDVDFYAQDLTMGPPPNDDLDLQIAWLAAVERYGRGVNASILGDYWLSYIIPNWVEYGMGKANLRAGMAPPISGALDNDYRNSCGCYIRSEIWACLAPGNPALAAKYAYEDAVVDHSDEGMQAELFCAALQSAAFVESDPWKLIDIGLSYVPEDGKFAAAIRAALDAKKEGLTFHEAIVKIHETCPGTFGVQSITYAEAKKRSEAMGFKTVGEPGMDAPENVAFAMAAWLYGKDFGERLVLKGLDLDIYRGEILGFVGPSGQGKSVLTLEITPKVTYTYTDKDGDTQKETKTISNSDIKAPVTISVKLPEGMSLENLFVKHGEEYIKPTVDKTNRVITWQQSSFSPSVIMSIPGEANIKLVKKDGTTLDLTLDASWINKALPADEGRTNFKGWNFGDGIGTISTITQDNLAKLIEKANNGTLTAKSVSG